MGATLQGSINLAGYEPVNLVVRFFTPNTQTEILKACVATDSSGNFTVEDIPAGTYDVGVKADCSLSELEEDKVFVAGATTSIDFGTLRRADLTGDDQCDSSELSLVGVYYRRKGDCYGYTGDWLKPAEKKPRDIIFIDGRLALNLSEDDIENELYLIL